MAITKSAKKSIRQSKRRKERNIVYKNKMKLAIKKIKALVSAKKIDEAKQSLPKIYEALDKTAKVGIIKKGQANRKKSRITKLINRNSK